MTAEIFRMNNVINCQLLWDSTGHGVSGRIAVALYERGRCFLAASSLIEGCCTFSHGRPLLGETDFSPNHSLVPSLCSRLLRNMTKYCSMTLRSRKEAL